MYFFLATLMTLLNAFFNPIIYAVRLREFRVAFIEFICRTGNEAEQIERQISGSASKAVASIEAGQEREGEAGQRVRQRNINKHVNVKNTDVLPQQEKCVAYKTKEKEFIYLFIYLFINPINADRQAQGSVSDRRENVTDTPFITTRTSN